MAVRRDYDGAADLRLMQRLAQRTWGPASRVHPGDLVWGRLSIPDAQDDMRTSVWLERGEVVAWAWVELPGDAIVLVDPSRADLYPEVLFWAESQATRSLTVEVMDADTCHLEVLDRRGYVVQPQSTYFTRHNHPLDAPLADVELPDGYSIVAVAPDQAEQRAAAHRLGWSDLGSRVTTESWAALAATWPYLGRTDLVVVSPEGEWVASALGWYDDTTRVGLVEPVSCAPDHRGRGLAHAVNLALLHGFRNLGATGATVLPRGDDGYPGPARLYRGLGYEPAASTQRLARP